MDRIELQLKKLHGHWTSQEFAGCVRSKADMDYIRSRFEKCDKKVKVSLYLYFFWWCVEMVCLFVVGMLK
jgi:hypothetical protein